MVMGHVTKLNGIQFAQANEGLVDDLQELYFLCGRVSTKGYGFLQNKYHSWRLSVSNPKRSHCFVHHRDIDSEFYDGRIYCLSVKDNENFLMRQKWKDFVGQEIRNISSSIFYPAIVLLVACDR